MKESKYQSDLIKRIKRRFPGCVVLKNDSSYLQGVPDLILLIGSAWAMLEVKMDYDSPLQPNQGYYVEKLAEMSFAAFVNPDNEEEVLNELQLAFGSGG